MHPVDREGTFRGTNVEYGTKEFPTGAVTIKFKAELTELYDAANESWIPWAEYQMEVYGDSFVVKKDGTLNDESVQALVNHAGWDGSFHSVLDATWRPTPCQFSVKAEEYKGKTFYKAAFINGFDDVPGGSMPQLAPDKVKSLDMRFGMQLRALAGNKMRNQAAPAAGTKPPSPPPAAISPTLAAANAHAEAGQIPF
jgi:hypothetical protein